MSFTRRSATPMAISLLIAGCSFEADELDMPGGSSGGPGAAGASGAAGTSGLGETLNVEVGDGADVFVDLDPLAEVQVSGDGGDSSAWDLKLSGWDVFTNGGVSGPGDGSAFGPLDPVSFSLPFEPSVPFLQADETGGAFRNWYDYDSPTHALYSRYHVYGLRNGERYFKLQILSYYGELEGAPVSALYQLRYAEVTAGGVGPTRSITNLDAGAGGPTGTDASPSGCVDLRSDARIGLTADEALESADWQLCFRRDNVSVNGELGGPGDTAAVDLDAASTPAETAEEVQARSARSEQARFDAVDYAALTARGVSYRGDRILTAFSDLWVDRAADPAVPVDAAWLVVGADPGQRFLILFERLEGSSDAAMGRVTLRVRALQ